MESLFVPLFGCFIVDVPTAKLIAYMRELLILFMMTTFQLWSIICYGQFFLHSPSNYTETLNWNFEALHDVSGNRLKELFVRRESIISLRSKPELVIPSVNSVLKGKNALRYFGSVIWNSLPIEIREGHSILSFVIKIKQ